MKKNFKNGEIKFQIKGIELMDFNIIYPKTPLLGEVIFKFNINVEVKLSNENSLVMVINSVDIVDNNTLDKYAFAKVNCIFWVENFMSFVDKKTKKAKFPNRFITAINSISISTTRGILYSQFKGTFLHKAVMPIIDPTFLEKNNTQGQLQ